MVYINEINCKNSSTFSKEFISKAQLWWNDMIFVDESQFYVYTYNGRKLMWYKGNQQLQINNIEPTMEYNSGSSMVWDCISTVRVKELFVITNTDRELYKNIVQLSESPHALPKSPNLNAIENLWNIIQWS